MIIPLPHRPGEKGTLYQQVKLFCTTEQRNASSAGVSAHLKTGVRGQTPAVRVDDLLYKTQAVVPPKQRLKRSTGVHLGMSK